MMKKPNHKDTTVTKATSTCQGRRVKLKSGTLHVFLSSKNAKTPKAYFESQSQATKEALKRLSKK